MMKKTLLILTLLFAFITFAVTFVFTAEDKANFEFKKQPEIQQIKPKKPVKIKFKRSPENKCSWELSGDDADEIARVDRRLQKLSKVN